MPYPLETPSFSLYSSDGPRGEVPQDKATRLTTGPSGKLIIETPDGEVDSGHPIDQGVVLSLTVRRGSIKSSSVVGNTLHEVDPGSKSIDADVRQRVLSAFPLSRYLNERTVTIRSIRHEVRPHGGLMVSVEYRNELLGVTRTATN